MSNNRTYIFEEMPVKKAVVTMAVPTIISQLISMIYNMADTFFVGQLGDAALVAAVSIAAPASLLLTALANLFGIGGASVFSRALGGGEPEKAKRASAFSLYAAFAVSIIIALCFVVFRSGLLRAMGAGDETFAYVAEYIKWVIVLGAPPSLLSMVLSHIARADGAAKFSGTVLSLGGLMNLILDPIFMFDWGLGLGLTGAAMATLISNCFTFAVFIGYFVKNRTTTAVSFRPSLFRLSTGKNIVASGLPGMLQTLLASVSNMVLNNTAAALGSTVFVASMGIVKKLDQLPMSVAIGFAQGVLPMIGYNYSAKNDKRVRDSLKFTIFLAMLFSVICVAVYELVPGLLIRIFINDPVVAAEGSPVLRIMCLCTPLMAITFNIVTAFQAMGRNKAGTLLSVLRKGAIDIPLLLLIAAVRAPMLSVAFVQPATELIAMIVALMLVKKIGFIKPEETT